jgi:lactoylglutathione lyase
MELPVESIDASIPFYENAMSFHVLSRNDSAPRSVVLERDGIQMGLVENGGDPTQDGCAFQTDNVEALFEEFSAKGLGKGLSELKTESRDDGSSWKVFFVVAPDGLCFWFGERQ